MDMAIKIYHRNGDDFDKVLWFLDFLKAMKTSKIDIPANYDIDWFMKNQDYPIEFIKEESKLNNIGDIQVEEAYQSFIGYMKNIGIDGSNASNVAVLMHSVASVIHAFHYSGNTSLEKFRIFKYLSHIPYGIWDMMMSSASFVFNNELDDKPSFGASSFFISSLTPEKIHALGDIAQHDDMDVMYRHAVCTNFLYSITSIMNNSLNVYNYSMFSKTTIASCKQYIIKGKIPKKVILNSEFNADITIDEHEDKTVIQDLRSHPIMATNLFEIF